MMSFLIFIAFFLIGMRIAAYMGTQAMLNGRLTLQGVLITGSVAPNQAWAQVEQNGQHQIRVKVERQFLGDASYEEFYNAVSMKPKPTVIFTGKLVADENDQRFFLADGFKIVGEK